MYLLIDKLSDAVSAFLDLLFALFFGGLGQYLVFLGEWFEDHIDGNKFCVSFVFRAFAPGLLVFIGFFAIFLLVLLRHLLLFDWGELCVHYNS